MSWDTTFYTRKAEICTIRSFKHGAFFDPQEVTKEYIEYAIKAYQGRGNSDVWDVCDSDRLEKVLTVLKTTDEKVYAKTM